MDEFDDFLEHYGKKGMRWGVRRDEKPLSDADKALNLSQRSQVRIASSISSLAAVGMASNAAATLFQLQSRFEHLRVLQEVQRYAESSPFVDDAGKEAIRQTRSHIVKGLVGSAIGATAISAAVGIVTRRTAKAYFAPLHKVYGDSKPKINKELKNLSKDIKNGKRPKLTDKEYEAEVSKIVSKHMTKDVSNAFQPFHELARSQLGTEFNTKSLTISFEKLPNTNLASKMTVTTPTGLKLVKAIKNVEHADVEEELAPDLDLFFDYKFDSDGHVIDWSCPTIEIADDLFEGRFDMTKIEKKLDPESNLQQSDSFEGFLQHYGVPGMRWGVRRSSGGSSSSTTKPAWASDPPARSVKTSAKPEKVRKIRESRFKKPKKELSPDAAEFLEIKKKVKKQGLGALSNDELKKVNQRVELQQKYIKAHPKKKNPLVDLVVDAILDDKGSAFITRKAIARNPVMGAKVGIVLEGLKFARKITKQNAKKSSNNNNNNNNNNN